MLRFLVLSAFISISFISQCIAAEKSKILLIAGNPSHGYGSHEHYAGLKILEESLLGAKNNIEVNVVRGWPEDDALVESADSIVIYCDGGRRHLATPHLSRLEEKLSDGCGLVCIHYAVEMTPGETGDAWVKWLGGHFEINWSVNPHWIADFKTLPSHPITQGVNPFKANDEWYFHMRFNPSPKVTPILYAIAPPETMRRQDGPHSGNPDVRKSVANGEPQTVAWAFERPDGGRSFGFTGGHFHWNWGNDDIRKLVTNAILWTGKSGIGPEGASINKPVGLDSLLQNQDYEPPKNFDRQRIESEFQLKSPRVQAIPKDLQSQNASNSAKKKARPRKLFESDVITDRTGGRTSIEASIEGVTDLFLVVEDGGDGFTCDWANWINPTLHGKKTKLSLLDHKWESASSGFGNVRKNLNCMGQKCSHRGVLISQPSIGTHSVSKIHYKLPPGFERFTAEGILDTGGTSQSNGSQASVRFTLYADAAPPTGSNLDQTGGEQRLASSATSGLTVGEGLEVTLSASEPILRSLTNIDVDHRGRVWVCDVMNYRHNNNSRPQGDRILILEDTDQDGVMDLVKTFYQGRDIDSAMGICVLGNQVIVSATPNIWRFTDLDGDDIPDRKEAIFTETGQPQHDHSAHSFLFGPDGRLYWNFGNTGRQVKNAEGETVIDIHGRPVVDNGKPFYGGMPFRCDLDGSNFEVLAHNFRNNYETTVDSFGSLWQSDNDDDGNRGTRINFVMEQGNYGYRDELTGAGWRDARITLEEEIPHRHWHLNDPGVVPNVLQTGAGSPSGICVYEGRLLPERFWDQVIHCDPGPNVVRAYPVQRQGAGYSATIDPLMTGSSDKWFRPADVCVAPDGSLFVSDWYDPGVGGHRQGDTDRGRLFRVSPPETPYVISEHDYDTPQGAVLALQSPNQSVRYLAWQAIEQMGAAAEAALLDLFQSENPRHRARSLWLLGRIQGRGKHYIDLGLQDKNEDLRCTAIRLAKQLKLSPAEVCEKAASDPSASVRRELAIALRFDQSETMPKVWATLANQHDGEDRWYLEALGIGSDLRADECFTEWLKQNQGKWDNKSGRDIAWRVRAEAAAELLVQIISNPSLTLQETNRYFRSLEYHKPHVRNRAMKKLLTL